MPESWVWEGAEQKARHWVRLSAFMSAGLRFRAVATSNRVLRQWLLEAVSSHQKQESPYEASFLFGLKASEKLLNW